MTQTIKINTSFLSQLAQVKSVETPSRRAKTERTVTSNNARKSTVITENDFLSTLTFNPNWRDKPELLVPTAGVCMRPPRKRNLYCADCKYHEGCTNDGKCEPAGAPPKKRK